MSDEMKLLPCAHCGETKPPRQQGNGIGDYWLDCIKCGCGTGLHEHIELCGKAWNRRPTPEQSGEARDGERLDWLVAHEAWIAWSNDGEVCRVFHRDEEGDPEPFEGWIGSTNYDTAREAIDAAMDRSALGREN